LRPKAEGNTLRIEMTYTVSGGTLNPTHSLTEMRGKPGVTLD